MNPFLRKRILISAVLGASLIGASYLISTNSVQKITYRNPSSKDSVALRSLISQDTDKDGIKDWEEALWGTNPRSSDTDKDGVPDAAEIEAMRSAAGFATTTGGNGEGMNETDVFSREFFAAALSLKESGNLNDVSIGSLTGVLLEGLAASTTASFYEEKDLILSRNSSKTAYKSALLGLSQKYAPYRLGTELNIIAEGISKESKAVLEKLGSYASSYERLSKDTMLIAVPEDIALVHLESANSYKGMAIALRQIMNVIENPITGFTAFSEYLLYEKRAETALKTLEIYLK